MARMVATKAALSIRVDALTDVDEKSEPTAPSIGIENRAKLEARLRALEEGDDAAGVRGARIGKKQPRFSMNGETSTYNTAADAVDLMPTQRDPLEAAVQATLEVKADKKKAKEDKKARKKVKVEQDGDEDDENKMDVDGEEDDEKKRKRGEDHASKKPKHDGETEEERKARKQAKKEAKAAAAAGEATDSTKKKRKKSES
jgi:nucleolar protein 58